MHDTKNIYQERGLRGPASINPKTSLALTLTVETTSAVISTVAEKEAPQASTSGEHTRIKSIPVVQVIGAASCNLAKVLNPVQI